MEEKESLEESKPLWEKIINWSVRNWMFILLAAVLIVALLLTFEHCGALYCGDGSIGGK